jgi:hypothetical protein
MKVEKRVKDEEDFYSECAKILGTEHIYRDCVPRPRISRDGIEYTPMTKATRWGGREPGNGRFPGFGFIRLFGNMVQVQITNPARLSGIFNNKEEALSFLRKGVENE